MPALSGIGKDIAKLADILGHSSINTTRIYIAMTANEHRRMENMATDNIKICLKLANTT